MKTEEKTSQELEEELARVRQRLTDLEVGCQRSRQQLLQAGRRTAEILESDSDAFFTLDREWRLTYLNRQAERLVRGRRQDLIGRNAWELFPEAVGTTFYREFRRTMEQRVPVAFEAHYAPLALWLGVRAYPSLEGIAVHLVDITERKRAEEVLERYRLLSQYARDIILFVRTDGRIIEANEAAVRAYGYSRQELQSMSIYDLRAPITTPAVAGQMAEADARGILFETVHRRKDGSLFPVEVSSQGTTMAEQRVLLSIIRDISERKQIEAERERLLAEVERRAAELDATIASVAVGLIIYDPAGAIARSNTAAEDVLRYSEEERRRPFAERLARLRIEAPQGRPLPLEETPPARALRGETVQGVVLVIHRPPQREIWLSVSAAPIRTAGGELLGAVATFTDITDLHELQEQREDILRAVSHDLRNPLAVVLAQAQLLIRAQEQAGLAGPQRQSAQAILTSAQRMNTMIQDLVDSVRLQAGQLIIRQQVVDLGRLAADLRTRLAGTLDMSRVRVEAPPDLPPVWADPDRVERILVNLLSNALKYSPPERQVTVSLARQDGQVITSVTDRGVGIPAEEMPHVFERYFRARTAGERREGLGLGLYISRMLVEAQGGRIWAQSQVGVGSTFSFSLPVAPPARLQGDAERRRGAENR